MPARSAYFSCLAIFELELNFGVDAGGAEVGGDGEVVGGERGVELGHQDGAGAAVGLDDASFLQLVEQPRRADRDADARQLRLGVVAREIVVAAARADRCRRRGSRSGRSRRRCRCSSRGRARWTRLIFDVLFRDAEGAEAVPAPPSARPGPGGTARCRRAIASSAATHLGIAAGRAPMASSRRTATSRSRPMSPPVSVSTHLSRAASCRACRPRAAPACCARRRRCRELSKRPRSSLRLLSWIVKAPTPARGRRRRSPPGSRRRRRTDRLSLPITSMSHW